MAAKFDIRNYTDGFKGFTIDGDCKVLKCDETEGMIFILNTKTNRATRFNAEGTNGKRIPVATFEEKYEAWIESEKTRVADEDLWTRHPEGEDLTKPAVINEHGCVDCSKCDVKNCVHRDCMRRNPKQAGGLGECPRLKVEPKDEEKYMAEEPKAKKTRRSKDVAYEGNGVTLTTKQVDFIRHLPDTYFWEDGLDSVIWVDVLCDDIGGQFAGKPMTVGAMISTLCEKGIGERATNRRDNRKCISFALTSLGQIVADELGLR